MVGLNYVETTRPPGETAKPAHRGTTMFSIRQIPGKGNGVVASKNIPKNTVIFQEEPLVLAQFLHNSRFFPACSSCMRSMESTQEMVMRLAGLDTKPKLPFVDQFDHVSRPTKTFCDKCQEMYCSEQCKSNATYHSRLCGESKIIAELKQWWQTFHYPPEEVSPMLLLRVISIILSNLDRGLSLEEALKPWMEFSGQTANESTLIRFLDAEFDSRIQKLVQYVRLALYDERCPQLFEAASIIALLGMISRNAQGVGTSNYDAYRRFILAMPEGKEKEDTLDFIDSLADPIEDISGQFTLAEGSGLYKLHKNLNHDCSPNAMITFPENSARLSVVTTKNIAAGEEVTISYLDIVGAEQHEHIKTDEETMDEDEWEEEDNDFGQERRLKLREFYLFECTCNRCYEEKAELAE
jgi:hypothetical protein